MQEKKNKKKIFYFISSINNDADFLKIWAIKKKFKNSLIRPRIDLFKLVIIKIIIIL
jgi:hypothetical protein